MPDPTLFHGIAVVIDDQILDEQSGIWKIQAQIKDEGCHVVSMQDLPSNEQLKNLRSASFFIVDWNLISTTIGQDLGVGSSLIPKGLLKENAARIVEFLKKLKAVRFAPVFIFTDHSVDTVREQLKKHKELIDEDGQTHIFIQSKADVQASGVFKVLSNSLQSAPSAYVLKRWEREYENAKNALFLDFYNKSVYWPLLLWKTFEDDQVSPSIELGNLIGRNLLSRMTPFEFDLGPFQDALTSLQNSEDNYRKLLLKVLEGERFLSKEQLHETSVAPGDVFKVKDHYFINIRPDCDCIARGNLQDALELYLLEGSKLTQSQVGRIYDMQYGLLRESDSQCIIFAMTAGTTVSFAFKTLKIETWGEWKSKRIGRLMPPFLTRLQQRYSAYLQRPGLNRVPEHALDNHANKEQPIHGEPSVKGTNGTIPVAAESLSSPTVVEDLKAERVVDTVSKTPMQTDADTAAELDSQPPEKPENVLSEAAKHSEASAPQEQDLKEVVNPEQVAADEDPCNPPQKTATEK
jgi:hypothetical protein